MPTSTADRLPPDPKSPRSQENPPEPTVTPPERSYHPERKEIHQNHSIMVSHMGGHTQATIKKRNLTIKRRWKKEAGISAIKFNEIYYLFVFVAFCVWHIATYEDQ